MSFALVLAALAGQVPPQSVNVPIQNASFEQTPSHAFNQDVCGPWIWEIPGWTITPIPGKTGGAGIFQPANPNTCGVSVPVPDGKTVAYISGMSISQNLGTAPGNDGVYTLTFYPGDRYYSYSAHYTVSLSFGVEVFCSISGEARGDWLPIPVTCPIQKNPTPQPLTLTITSTGEFTLLVDKVSVQFAPTS